MRENFKRRAKKAADKGFEERELKIMGRISVKYVTDEQTEYLKSLFTRVFAYMQKAKIGFNNVLDFLLKSTPHFPLRHLNTIYI